LNPVSGDETRKAATGILKLDAAMVAKLNDILFK